MITLSLYEQTTLKEHLAHTFKKKDLGLITYFLRLEFQPTQDGLSIHQHKYAKDLLHLAHLTDSPHSRDTTRIEC